MAQQLIGIGTTANDGTGDPLRTALTKVNANDTELYGRTNASTTTSSGIIELATGAEVIALTDAVRAVSPSGLSSFFANGQIPFPATQNPSSDPNTLDDYEEGTWTPVLTFGGASVGITYGAQTGRYTKVGNVVLNNFNIALTSKGSSAGVPAIGSVAFSTTGNGLTAFAIYSTPGTFSGLTAGLQGFLGNSSTSISVRAPGTTGSATMADTNFTNTSGLIAGFVSFT